MNRVFILLLLIMNSFSAFSQASNDDSIIYNTVLDYYFSRYHHHDTTKPILIIDSTEHINLKRLNIIIEIRKNYLGEGNYFSYYHDCFDLDTSDFRNIEIFNEKFYLKTLVSENLASYFGKHKNIKLIRQSYIDTVFLPFKSIDSLIEIDSVSDVLNNCWLQLTREMDCLGFCSFSRPYIINENKALIYFSFMQGPLAGMSMVLILVKELSGWNVKREINLGTS